MVTAVNDGSRDMQEMGGGNVGHQYQHMCTVCRSLAGLNR